MTQQVGRPQSSTDPILARIRIWIGVALIMVGIWVAVNPSIVYAKTPRVVLFFLLSILPALLFVGELQAHFELKLPGMIATGGGMFASCVILLYALITFSSQDLRGRLYVILGPNGSDQAALMGADVVKVYYSGSLIPGNAFVRGNELLIVFPEDVGKATLSIKYGDHIYSTILDSGRIRDSPLVIGKDLK